MLCLKKQFEIKPKFITKKVTICIKQFYFYVHPYPSECGWTYILIFELEIKGQ